MKYLVSIIIIFSFSCALKKAEESKDVQIELLSYVNNKTQNKYDMLKIKIFNTTKNDMWYYIHGFGMTSSLENESKERPTYYKKIDPSNNNRNLPDYILVKAMDNIEISYFIYLREKYNLEKDKTYYLYYGYENSYSIKKDSKIKTFIGKVSNIKPLKIVY
ncbi:MAG: hypothetical protein K9I26_00505 [Flavobacterium sp.]|nr:hypothetical protein [Flavobacterium sp.]